MFLVPRTWHKELMKKLTKARTDLKAKLIAELQARHSDLEDAIAAYNVALGDARAFCEEIAEEARTYHGDRSEAWQEGDAGSAYSDWVDAWDDASGSLDDVDSVDDASDTLNDLPDAPESGS